MMLKSFTGRVLQEVASFLFEVEKVLQDDVKFYSTMQRFYTRASFTGAEKFISDENIYKLVDILYKFVEICTRG